MSRSHKIYGYIFFLLVIAGIGMGETLDHGVTGFLYRKFPNIWLQDIQPIHFFLYQMPKIIIGISIGWWSVCLLFYPDSSWSERVDYYGRALIFSLSLIILVVVLKWITNTSCPWDSVRYGGVVESTRWLFHGNGLQRYECFPAGHATSGFALLGWLYVYKDRQSHSMFALIVFFGLCLGSYQIMRGAHYVSHTLMTWYLACLLWELCVWLPIARASDAVYD